MAKVIENTGTNIPLRIKQGADFGPIELVLVRADGSAVDLTGALLRGQIRKNALDSAIVASFSFSITDATGGKATMSLADDLTVAIPAGESPNDDASLYWYDIEVVELSGKVSAPMWGSVTMLREVTRP